MHKKFFNAMYAFNIVLQGIFSLVAPAALMALIAWLLTSKCGAPDFLFVPFIIIGFILGLISMIRFIIAAMTGIERLEAEWEREEKNKKRKIAKINSKEGFDSGKEKE